MSSLFGKSKRKRSREATVLSTTAVVDDQESNNKVARKTEVSTLASSSMSHSSRTAAFASFADLGLAEPLVQTCRTLGLKRPTAVQRTVIPFLLQNRASHVLALAPTGSGKTAAFGLPLLQHLSTDPYGIYAVVLTPTRELAKQIHQQILALGSAYKVTSVLVMGGCDAVRQANDLTQQRPHFCVATPGRLGELLRSPAPPGLKNVRYLVMDEADRLLAAQSGFERDVAEVLLQCNPSSSTPNVRRQKEPCQTLLFSATWTESLSNLEDMAGSGFGRLPLQKFILTEDTTQSTTTDAASSRAKAETSTTDDAKSSEDDGAGDDAGDDLDEDNGKKCEKEESMAVRPKIPAGLKQEYVFMPARVRDAYLVAAIRRLIANGGRPKKEKRGGRGKAGIDDDDNTIGDLPKARSAILFVSTCERCALVSQLLTIMGVHNVALHSLLSQNRRLAALGQFQSEQVRILVATDVCARGLDIPTVDLVVNVELPRQAVNYIHRVGRTARAGRRGRALSLVAPDEVALVHTAEAMAGRPLQACSDVKDEHAMPCLGPVLKATRVAKLKLQEIGFDELVQKFRERKVRQRQERQRIQKALRRQEKKKR